MHHPKCNVLIATLNPHLYIEIMDEMQKYIAKENIYSLPRVELDSYEWKKSNTIIGRHSYGPIARNHLHIESIGNFCSIAIGADVIPNHPTELLSMHPFLYSPLSSRVNEMDSAEIFKAECWYVGSILENGYDRENKKSKIGNDVWIGRNALIISGINIGNGAVIGAGAVVTHDIPDYAVAVGVPARVIRYRYTKEQIKALNTIKWWNWTDEQIAERYDDFFLNIDEFIKKHQFTTFINKRPFVE